MNELVSPCFVLMYLMLVTFSSTVCTCEFCLLFVWFVCFLYGLVCVLCVFVYVGLKWNWWWWWWWYNVWTCWAMVCHSRCDAPLVVAKSQWLRHNKRWHHYPWIQWPHRLLSSSPPHPFASYLTTPSTSNPDLQWQRHKNFTAGAL